MKLYEAPSPNARRVHIALAEKGIEVERVAVTFAPGKYQCRLFGQKSRWKGAYVRARRRHMPWRVCRITRYLDAMGEGPSLFGDTLYAKPK